MNASMTCLIAFWTALWTSLFQLFFDRAGAVFVLPIDLYIHEALFTDTYPLMPLFVVPFSAEFILPIHVMNTSLWLPFSAEFILPVHVMNTCLWLPFSAEFILPRGVHTSLYDFHFQLNLSFLYVFLNVFMNAYMTCLIASYTRHEHVSMTSIFSWIYPSCTRHEHVFMTSIFSWIYPSCTCLWTRSYIHSQAFNCFLNVSMTSIHKRLIASCTSLWMLIWRALMLPEHVSDF